MEKTVDIVIDLFKVDILWFEKFSPENPDVEDFVGIAEDKPGDPDIPMFVLSCAYDFDINSDGVREVYIDVHTKLPHYANMKSRVYYRLEKSMDFEWDNLFTSERLRILLENAIQNGLYHFVKQCTSNRVTLPPGMLEHQPEIPPHEIDNMAANLINDYFSHRKPYLESNAEVINMHAITLSPSQNWIITLHLTLLVMEEVLFNNLHFNRRRNREKFFEIVPEHFFYSLRSKCIQLNTQEITFNQVEIHYWLIAQDCALQMALGEKADALAPIIVSRGFTNEIQKIWHTGASKLVESCRGTVEDSIASKEKFDWYKILG
jgi:hypothetical protein